MKLKFLYAEGFGSDWFGNGNVWVWSELWWNTIDWNLRRLGFVPSVLECYFLGLDLDL